MRNQIFLLLSFLGAIFGQEELATTTTSSQLYFAVNTWSGDFSGATTTAYKTLDQSGTALDGIESGCKYCEEHQCDTTVGYGNHPDTHGDTSLDAMIMDGTTFDMGAVGYIRKYRDVISIARSVMYYTGHTFLVGDGAENFAAEMGFTPKSATTSNSVKVFESWKNNDNCQPNFYENIPDAKVKCGPYNISSTSLSAATGQKDKLWQANKENHDTIGMVTRDKFGNMACGTSTNGANHKVTGRIGDSPIPGAGCYVNTAVGGATATGDGDVMMRFLPSFHAVSLMENGMSPKDACQSALNRITSVFPSFSGGLVCITKDGKHAGATNNMNFSYSLMMEGMAEVQVIPVEQ